MPYPDFAQFAQALCDAAGVECPPLHPDASGLVTFHLVLTDVAVDLVHAMLPGNDQVHMLVNFGAVTEDKELAVLRLTGDANYTMMDIGSPVLCRHPHSGHIVLRQSALLSRAVAQSAFESIVRMADLARRWRVNPTMSDLDASSTLMTPQHLA